MSSLLCCPQSCAYLPAFDKRTSCGPCSTTFPFSKTTIWDSRIQEENSVYKKLLPERLVFFFFFFGGCLQEFILMNYKFGLCILRVLWMILLTSSHCIAVVRRWAMKIEVLLFDRDFKAPSISASVVLSSALVASSHNLKSKPYEKFIFYLITYLTMFTANILLI